MGLRDLYNRLEQVATPLAHQVVRTEEFAQLVAIVTSANKTLRTEADKLAARAWHAVNLPAGTDVQRLKQQVGSLDRELRLLSLELQRARQEAQREARKQAQQQAQQQAQEQAQEQPRKEAERRGDPRPEHD